MSDHAVKSADIFFTPSPGVRLIACNEYGNGANNGIQTTIGFILPLIATLLAMFAKSAACSCVVLVYRVPCILTTFHRIDWNSINHCNCPGNALCTIKTNH